MATAAPSDLLRSARVFHALSDETRLAIRLAAPPLVIYVSCGPRSLAADLAVFLSDGYSVTTIQPFDLLPGTPHVETVVRLERA